MAACVLARVLRVLRVLVLGATRRSTLYVCCVCCVCCVCFCVMQVVRVLRVLRVLLRALVLVRVLLRHARVRRHVLCSWFPPTPGNPGTPPRCVCLYVYAGHDPDHRGEHGKNSWDVLKWDVLKSVGRKYEKGKLCECITNGKKQKGQACQVQGDQ